MKATFVVLPDDGIVDGVAVERALDGHPLALTLREIREVVRRHVLERNGSLKSAANLPALSERAVRVALDGVDKLAFFGIDLQQLAKQRQMVVDDVPEHMLPAWRQRKGAAA